MTPDELTAAANALTAATQASAVNAGQQTETATAALAPGLATGSNAPGGRNYQANIAPVVPALTSAFVVNAKQGALRAAIRDALNNAQTNYNTAQSGYHERQRAFQVAQAEKSRQRQRQSDAVTAAQLALASGGGKDNGVGGTEVVSTDQYIGNNDYRGRLNWLSKNAADPAIKNAAGIALKYVGNDMKYKLSPYVTNPEILNALDMVGAINVWQPSQPAPKTNTIAPAQTFNFNTLK